MTSILDFQLYSTPISNLPLDPTLCIYHKNCFDGICSAWVVQKRYPSIELYPMGYSDLLPQFMIEHKSIIIVDFSFSREILEKLTDPYGEYRINVLVIDHHKTAEEALSGLPYAMFDMEESGASLAWKVLFPEQAVPWLVRYIKDRDLWQFKLWESEAINSYIQSYPMTVEDYNRLYYKIELDATRVGVAEAGKSILRYKQTMVEAMCKNAAGTDGWPFFDSSIPIVNASILFYEVGNELCKLYPKAPFAAYYFDRLSDGVRQWGLRSIGDFDVSAIAKELGGGGHRNAAGFEHSIGRH